MKHRATLGLDPRSEAALAKDRAAASVLAVDLGQLAERGRAALEAREAAGLAPPPDLAALALERTRATAPHHYGDAHEPAHGPHSADHAHDAPTTHPAAASAAPTGRYGAEQTDSDETEEQP